MAKRKPTKKVELNEVLSLEAEVTELKKRNRQLVTKNKELGKKGLLVRAVVSEVLPTIKPMKPTTARYKRQVDSSKHQESVVMHLSDEHMDEIIRPGQVNGLESYNFKVAMRRAETYVDSVIRLTQHTLESYQFQTLWILAYGDHTNGQIHEGVEKSEFKNQFRNAFAVGQVHAQMIRELAGYFAEVKVVYVPGNHGRNTPRKKHHDAFDSWDYAIAEISKGHCSDLKNVEFLIPESHSIMVSIEGHTFWIEHGDDVKSWNSIPFYGLERKSRRLSSIWSAKKKDINYFVYGHFHQPAMLNAQGNNEMIVNGAWKATDPWALGALSGFVEPSQWLHGVHAKRGITWRYKVRLRSAGEARGPKRYKVSIGAQ